MLRSHARNGAPAPARGGPGGMSLARYVLIARILHWSVATLIIAAIALGLVGDALPYRAGETAARSTFIYALHKTIGIAALAVALPFAAWLFLSPRPRRAGGRVGLQAVVWRVTYWGLFFGMLLLPVTGPLLHSNGPSWGFAPILWPLPPRVPGIPDSFAAHPAVGAFHRDGWWLFAGLTAVHVILYVRRRLDRSRRTGRSATGRPGADLRLLLRLSPAAGLAGWVVLFAATWPR